MLERRFTVRIGGETIGRIVDVSVDWPWHRGSFVPAAAFDRYSMLFAECLAAKQSEERERLMANIFAAEFELVAEESGAVFRATPHRFTRGQIVRFFIEGTEARFRFG